MQLKPKHKSWKTGLDQSPSSGWRRVFLSTRTRILAWYVLLMSASALMSIVMIRQILLTRLQGRVERSLTQEVQEFRQLVDGQNPATGKPFGDNLAAVFKVFLRRNIPDNHEFLLTLLNGKFYRSSPRAVPTVLGEDGKLVQSLAQLTKPERCWVRSQTGEIILYRAEPFVRGKNRGVFVVAHSISAERQEVNEAIVVIANVMLGVLIFASVIAWVVSGQVMAPLRLLTEAAGITSESDLTRRIPVYRFDEIGELTIRFNEMLDRLQTAFTSQREFINDVGHELRTPITIIRGHLELMGDDPKEQQETLLLVTDELDRMSRFVDDLLLLAKAQQPNFLHLELVDVALLTEELFAKAKALAPRNWCLDTKGTGRIVADHQRLTQAVMNLAQNATQHTEVNNTIALGSSLQNGTACFWVRDTGEGIPLTDQQRIFERFARGENSYRRSDGTGLGLAIVRAISQAHGGRVKLVSRPGEGATFTLIIPVDPV
ncbi:ATP-binding protein [Brasilonema sp. UFV-L1]|uniref:sensor histidine kinase n=1 Tax=Brasilonema sp. UFV-L1 TaxID=2234130 RepID=UPI002006EB51|nr:ATP-binding protein [Brasilonema sp. UFV-L1]